MNLAHFHAVRARCHGAIAALAADWALPGNAQVLQNGVMSNAVPFTVDALQLASISPTSGTRHCRHLHRQRLRGVSGKRRRLVG